MLTLDECDRLSPRSELVHNGTSVVPTTPTPLTHRRVDSLFEKDPITIRWIAEFAGDARRVGAAGDRNVRRDLLRYHDMVANPRHIEQRQSAAQPAPPVTSLSF